MTVNAWGTVQLTDGAARRNRSSDIETRVLHAYSDETELKDGAIVGAGVFLAESPIDQSIVVDALARLAAEGQALRPEDRRTLERGYFHASNDSTRAKLALAAVVKQRITGTLFCTYRLPALRPTRGRKPKVHRVQELMLKFGTLALTSTRRRIELQVERRKKLGRIASPGWVEELNRARELGVVDNPNIPRLFPFIDVTIGEKKEPGLQVADLLLWAANRSGWVRGANRQDVERVDPVVAASGLEPAFGHWHPDDGDQTAVFYVGRETPEVHIRYPCGLPVPDVLGEDGAFRAWEAVEKTLHSLADRGLPDHAQPYEESLREVAATLAGDMKFDIDLLWRAASVFIRLFDTVPIYQDVAPDDEEKWTLLLFARRIASLIQRKDLVHGMTAAHALVRWRRRIVVESPGVLGLQAR